MAGSRSTKKKKGLSALSYPRVLTWYTIPPSLGAVMVPLTPDPGPSSLLTPALCSRQSPRAASHWMAESEAAPEPTIAAKGPGVL